MKDRTIDTLTLQQYVEGTLDPRKSHELEKQALEDEFLADALEGYTYVIEPAEKLSILQQRLSDRILVQEANKKAFSISAQRLSIAAAAGVMFLLAVILFWMNGFKTSTITRQVQVELAPAQLNPVDGVKQARALAKKVVSPIIALVEKESALSEPVSGWDQYNRYIQKNVPEIPALTNLVISFKVNSQGRPTGLKLIEGNLDDQSKEVIRAIKDGPQWKSAGNEEIKIRISFRH